MCLPLLPQLLYYHNTHLKSYALFLSANFMTSVSSKLNVCWLYTICVRYKNSHANNLENGRLLQLQQQHLYHQQREPWITKSGLKANHRHMRNMSKQPSGPHALHSPIMEWAGIHYAHAGNLRYRYIFWFKHRLRRKYFSQHQKTHFVL